MGVTRVMHGADAFQMDLCVNLRNCLEDCA
jgi:hypothetical protein